MRRRRQAGFTLLELLVAITLLGLMMTMIFSGLRLGTRAWEAAEARDHEAYLVQQLLRAQLGAAYVPSGFDPVEPLGDESYFAGRADQVVFVAPLPEAFGVAGLHRVSVQLVEAGNGRRDLVIAWRLWRPDGELIEAAEADADERNRRVLLEGVTAAAFSFFGPHDDLSERLLWQDAWQGRADLPVLVRLDLLHPEHPWPALIAVLPTRLAAP